MRFVLLLTGAVLGAGGGNVLLRAGMAVVGGFAEEGGVSLGKIVSVFTNWSVISGLVLYALSMILWLELLSRHELTYVYPVFVASLFVLVTTLSALVLHETVSALRLVGIAVITIGIAIASLSS